MDENPAIAMSFRNQFVPSIGYTYTFDRTYGAAGNRRFYWQNSVTSAGNLLSGILRAFGERQPQPLFGNRFSQFVKEVSELKFYHRIGRRNNWLATRLLVGAGYAYGNSEVMPYSEQFYIGGANSIRAFTIRSLGPGSYRPPADDRNGYLDQTGDFKLEANIEYRFGIMGRLNGAVFLDAGNIWLLKKDPKRPGAELKWKGFLNDIALGTGFGLRYDISYLDGCRETLSSLMDLYTANNDMRMNDIMKRLTIVSTIFIPLTFLVGVWGMNFRHMPELEWRHGYAVAWGVMLAVGVAAYFVFRTKRWR